MTDMTLQQLTLIDARVADLAMLQADLEGRSAVLVLDPAEDGLARLGEALARMGQVSALHLVGHGAPGGIELGAASLSVISLRERAALVAGWADALAGADLNLYGCESGAGQAGRALVQALAAMTGARVAASSSVIGSADKGGNWDLDVTSDGATAPVIFTPRLQVAYAGAFPSNVTFSITPDHVVESPASSVTFTFTLDEAPAAGEYVSIWLYATATKGAPVSQAIHGYNAELNQFDLPGPNGVFNAANYDGVLYPFAGSGAYDPDVTVIAGVSNVPDFGVLEFRLTARTNSLTFWGFDDGVNDGPRTVYWNVMDDPTKGPNLTVSTPSIRFTEVDVPGEVGQGGNTAPTITSNGGKDSATLSRAENGRAVMTLAARDAEGDKLAWSISGGSDRAFFSIDSKTGALAFRNAPNFEAPKDSGGNNIYDVVVRVSDGSATDTQALAVRVTDLNEVPVITANGGKEATTLTRAENKAAVMTMTATDPDKDTLTWALSGGVDKALFSINARTGALAFRNAPDFENPKDSGGNNIYDVVVRVSDGKLSDSQALAIRVGNVAGKILNGTAAADRITGTAEGDTLRGLAGDDVIRGGRGDDRLVGGKGADDLYGGAGKDVFVFNSLTDSTRAKAGQDTIFDFNGLAGDRIDLRAIDANSKIAGNQAFTFIGQAGFSGTAGELRVTRSSSDTFIRGDVNGDKVADFVLHLDDSVSLTKAFFLL